MEEWSPCVKEIKVYFITNLFRNIDLYRTYILNSCRSSSRSLLTPPVSSPACRCSSRDIPSSSWASTPSCRPATRLRCRPTSRSRPACPAMRIFRWVSLRGNRVFKNIINVKSPQTNSTYFSFPFLTFFCFNRFTTLYLWLLLMEKSCNYKMNL